MARTIRARVHPQHATVPELKAAYAERTGQQIRDLDIRAAIQNGWLPSPRTTKQKTRFRREAMPLLVDLLILRESVNAPRRQSGAKQ